MPRSGPCASYWTGRSLGPDLDDHLIGQSWPLPQLNTGLCRLLCVSRQCVWPLRQATVGVSFLNSPGWRPTVDRGLDVARERHSPAAFDRAHAPSPVAGRQHEEKGEWCWECDCRWLAGQGRVQEVDVGWMQ